MPKVDVYIYGSIGKPWWADESYNGVEENDVRLALDALDKADVHNIHFNSFGGLVKVGVGIMNVVRAHRQRMKLANNNFKLCTINDGMCYSAATYGFLVGDERVMNLGSNLLLHNAQSYCEGNANDMENAAKELRTLDVQLADTYSKLLGKEPQHYTDIMELNQIMNAEKSVDLGLATKADTNEATNLFPDFSPENVQKVGFNVLLLRAMHKPPEVKNEKKEVNDKTLAMLDRKLALAKLNRRFAGAA